MKYILVICLLVPLLSFAQKKADYEHVMARFARYYNNIQADSINLLDMEGKSFWSNKDIKYGQEKYGTILSYKYLGIDTTDPNKVRVFKIKFSKKGPSAISFTLNKTNHTETFRFVTSSDEIERMLKASK